MQPLKSLETEMVIDVSQDAVTSPAPAVASTPPPPPPPPPSKEKPQNDKAIRREESTESTQVVNESSLQDIAENDPQRQASSPRTPARPAAGPAPPDESEELYDATPLGQRQKLSTKPLATGPAAEHTRLAAEISLAGLETQKEDAATTSVKPSSKVRRHIFADVPDPLAEANAAEVTPKPRLLTQTSKSDKLVPAPGTSTDPPASTTGRENSNQSSAQFDTPRNASAGSKTSAMASAAKSAAAALQKSKGQPAATGTSARAKLEAIKAAQAGTSASANAALPTKAASTAQAPPRVEQQAGPSKATTSRTAEAHVSAVADDRLDKEQPAPLGELPRLSKPTAAAKLSISKLKNAPMSDDPAAEIKPAMTIPKDVKKTTNIAKQGKLEGNSPHKQKAGPFAENEDETNEVGEPRKSIARGNGELEPEEPIKRTRNSVTAASRKRKSDDERRQESQDDTAETVKDTKKRPGAPTDFSTTTKRQKQAATSSWNEDVDGGEYEVPVSPVKKTTKKGKAAGRSKATSPHKATRSTTKGKGHAGASTNAKTTGSTRAVAKMEVNAAADEGREPHGGNAKHVRGQAKEVQKTVVGTIKSPKIRGGNMPMAAGSKAEGKKSVSRMRHEGSNVQSKQSPLAPPGSKNNGQTPDDAIVLSDNDDKSSSDAGSLTPKRPIVKMLSGNAPMAHQTSMPPTTPAPEMSSSPPEAMNDEARQLADLQKSVRQHKPTVIEFAKNGPRNQGVAAVKTPGPRSLRNASVAPWVKRKHDPSSFATSVRSGRPTQRAPSSNIASNVDDALSDLAKKAIKPSFQMSMEPDDMGVVQNAEQHTKHSDVAAIGLDDEFTNVDTYDDDHALVQTFSPPKATPIGPPAEQQRIPSAVEACAPIATTKVTAQLLGKAVPKDEHTLSKRSEEKTMPDRDGRPEQPPQKPRKPTAAKVEVQAATNDHEAITQPRVKRPLTTEDEIKPPAKRSKADVNVANIVDRGRRRTNAAQLIRESNVVASGTPQEGAEKTMPPPAAPAKRSRAIKKPLLVPAETVEPEPARRVKGRPSRQTTHGAQTVDVHGSPVPSQMIVGHTKTVLETYSQQAGMVSDQDAVEETLQRQRTQTLADMQQPEDNLHYHVPQLHQPEQLSSNAKPVPAAPQAASNVVPKLRLTQSQSEQLLGNRDTLAKMLDPFSSSNSGVATEGSEPSSEVMSGFAFQLEEKMKQLGDQSQSEEDESDATVIYTEHQKPEVEPNQGLVSRSTSSEYGVETYDDDMAKLRAITSLTRRPQQEDPEKTLVNDDDVDESQEYGKDAPLEKSQQEPEDLELSDPASDDLTAWRKTLESHQLNLFQELIKTAQRLTVYFVEQENSVLRNVEKAHRQKIYAIEQEEMARAKTYQTKQEELKRLRKSKTKELKKCQANLLENLEQKKREQEDRMAKAAQWEEDNENLEALISKLS